MALERVAAVEALDPAVRVRTVGADKAYHRKDLGVACRQGEIAAHVARKEGLRVTGWDERRRTKVGYRLSQKVRKWVEEIFGWIQTVGRLKRSRYRGRERTRAWGYFGFGAYHLLRMARLSLAGAR